MPAAYFKSNLMIKLTKRPRY